MATPTNLPKKHWDELEEKYPGDVEYFLQWVEEYMQKDSHLIKFSLDQFFEFPVAMQLGIFYQYLAYNGCSFELDVCDTQECVNSIDDYFCEERSYHLNQKAEFKAGNL